MKNGMVEHEHAHYHATLRVTHTHPHAHNAKEIGRPDHDTMRHAHPDDHAGMFMREAKTLRVLDPDPLPRDVIDAALYVGGFLTRLDEKLAEIMAQGRRCPFCGHDGMGTAVLLVHHLVAEHLAATPGGDA